MAIGLSLAAIRKDRAVSYASMVAPVLPYRQQQYTCSFSEASERF